MFRPVEPHLPRAELLADPDLRPVFAHLQSRRRLPGLARSRLGALLPDLPRLGTAR
ncbi:hypothetical protein [Pseudonocardia sp. D17]|uniref:hypothetical protein n=1 Tax=Pseudonocardia sp. D17 TaxID=882661 RepID=UPI0030CE2CA4|nr:hypothetical protein PSD17_29880 [Pseudonocardia sp. D17]